MPRSRRFACAAVLVVAAMSMAGCGDSGTSTVAPDDIEFGEGSIPSAIPDDFPVPSGAVIGSYLVDRVNKRSEVELRIPSDIDIVAQFYNLGLVNNGYVVDQNSRDGRRWLISFRRDDLRGEVDLTLADTGITQAVVEVNDV